MSRTLPARRRSSETFLPGVLPRLPPSPALRLRLMPNRHRAALDSCWDQNGSGPGTAKVRPRVTRQCEHLVVGPGVISAFLLLASHCPKELYWFPWFLGGLPTSLPSQLSHLPSWTLKQEGCSCACGVGALVRLAVLRAWRKRRAPNKKWLCLFLNKA